MCLCADHFAKWQYGAIEAKNILGDIDKFKAESEGEDSRPVLKITLCGEECEITFKKDHLIDLQELLRVSEDQV